MVKQKKNGKTTPLDIVSAIENPGATAAAFAAQKITGDKKAGTVAYIAGTVTTITGSLIMKGLTMGLISSSASLVTLAGIPFLAGAGVAVGCYLFFKMREKAQEVLKINKLEAIGRPIENGVRSLEKRKRNKEKQPATAYLISNQTVRA